MDAASVFVSRELTKRIQAKRTVLLEAMKNGVAKDYADYRERAGFLKGLDEVMKWFEEIKFEDEAHGPFGQDADNSPRRPQGRHLA